MSTVATESIAFELDGQTIEAAPGETILIAARRAGVDIPHLCYTEGMRPDGNCRACVVGIEGERVLAPSCCRSPKQGMEVTSDGGRALQAQKMVLELLQSEVADTVYKTDSELDHWAMRLAVGNPRFARRQSPAADPSHAAIAVNLDAFRQQRAGRSRKGRHDVYMGDGFVYDGARLDGGWPFHEERHTDATFKQRDLPAAIGRVHFRDADIARPAIVAGKDDDCVFGQALFFELVHDAPDAAVDGTQHGGVHAGAVGLNVADGFIVFPGRLQRRVDSPMGKIKEEGAVAV